MTNQGAPPRRTTPALEAREVHKSYRVRGRSTPVLAGASLRVEPGEIVGVYGPSGSGKSTLLRLLAGLEPPDAGAVHLTGTPIEAPHRRRRDRRGAVMAVFQDPVASLDPRWPLWRSITEPLTVGPRSHRPSTEERRSVAARSLATIGLEGLDIDARPAAISRGQCQRVAVLRATAAGPKVILADEPTSALDVSVAAGVIRLLANVAASGTSLVVVSHDLDVLDVLSNRVLRMQDGRLEPVPDMGEASMS